MMVLKEEFFPLMEEVKNSVSLMIKGANGNVFQECIQSTKDCCFDYKSQRNALFKGSVLFFFVF